MLKNSGPSRATTHRSFGRAVLAAALFAAGLIGVAALWAAWPRTPGTSPLAALFASAWSCTYLVAAVLTWRGSHRAAPAFVAAMALLLPVFWFIFPGNWMLAIAPLSMTVVVGLLGYRYLHRRRTHGAERTA